MFVLVTYDVATTTAAGRKRLRQVAKACLDFGQRAQNSVFECKVDPAQFAALKHRLLGIVKLDQDSIRFYFLGKHWKRRVEHHGAKPTVDVTDPLIV